MKVGFIGTGNMGGALAHAAAQSPAPAELLLSNRTPEKAQALAQQLGATVSDNETIAQTCDYIFLGVKPQMMADLLARLQPILSRRQEGFVLVSMAAGLTLQRLREMAGLSCPILRIMPNTACAVGAGLTLYVPSPEVTEEQLDQRYARIAELRSQEMRIQGELEELEKLGTPELTMDNIARVIELWTKIPASTIKEDEFERLAKLDERLKEHIVGQDEAVNAVCSAIKRSRVGLQVKRKPVSFIFVGGTGVGKTELVKRLAADMFDSPESLIRLDMSEFMEKFSVSRIIGSPPGYVGYDEAGQLTEKIRRRPYSVVLFDEIEKAHPDVMNLLLQILDDGRITDAQGRTVNFENTVIILTTNAGSNTRTGTLGFGLSADDQSRERAQRALNEFLRPEFLNRLDEIVYFNHLTEENFRAIASLMLGEVRTAMAERGMTLHWTPAVVDYLVAKGYSETYGARNLRRTIQRDVEDAIASAVVAQRKAAGDVAIDAQNDRIVVTIDGKEVTA